MKSYTQRRHGQARCSCQSVMDEHVGDIHLTIMHYPNVTGKVMNLLNSGYTQIHDVAIYTFFCAMDGVLSACIRHAVQFVSNVRAGFANTFNY